MTSDLLADACFWQIFLLVSFLLLLFSFVFPIGFPRADVGPPRVFEVRFFIPSRVLFGRRFKDFSLCLQPPETLDESEFVMFFLRPLAFYGRPVTRLRGYEVRAASYLCYIPSPTRFFTFPSTSPNHLTFPIGLQTRRQVFLDSLL